MTYETMIVPPNPGTFPQTDINLGLHLSVGPCDGPMDIEQSNQSNDNDMTEEMTNKSQFISDRLLMFFLFMPVPHQFLGNKLNMIICEAQYKTYVLVYIFLHNHVQALNYNFFHLYLQSFLNDTNIMLI